MNRHPAVVVLDALLDGLEVEIPWLESNIRCKLVNGHLCHHCHMISYERGRKVREGEQWLPLDLSLGEFLQACSEMSKERLVDVAAKTALNRLKEG